ncbi:hypothetical protein DPMN_185953 [Dreissena polymorpha]|uniref:Uncharacterized protein n=1 Tax=Dreissena polymorpha TaxID=45954 RepID=A0A9D4DKQ8_DREPO|nr:hypothetical protein DPMN_185953 [Dreissena polymorpha]
MKLHRYIDHDSQMTPIDFQVTRSKVKVTSPGPLRLANAGENQNDSYNLFNAVTLFPGAAPVVAGQQSGRIPVYSVPATVYPGEARFVAGNAQMKAGSVLTEPRYTVTPPALTGAIPASDPGRATATPRFKSGRRR